MKKYSHWLQKSRQPKLMIYAVPGFMTTITAVQWAKNNLTNLAFVEFQDVLHFTQESISDIFSHKLQKWYVNNCK